jgi:hypothetical protein
MRSTQKEHIAATGLRFAGRPLDLANPATTVLVAAALVGAGLASLAVASHRRGAAVPVEAVETIVPAGVERTFTTTAPNLARPPSPALRDARFRFGCLEFEDDP